MTPRKSPSWGARATGSAELDDWRSEDPNASWMAASGGLLALAALAAMLVLGAFDLEQSSPAPGPASIRVPPALAPTDPTHATPLGTLEAISPGLARLRLQGVVRSSAGRASLALVSSGEEAARAVAVGDPVLPGMVVLSIETDRVSLGPPGGTAVLLLRLESSRESSPTMPDASSISSPRDERAPSLDEVAETIHYDASGQVVPRPETTPAAAGHMAAGEVSAVTPEVQRSSGRPAGGRRNRLHGVVTSPSR